MLNGLSPRATSAIRAVLVAGYLGVIALCAASPLGPRVFWTILLPVLPIALVVLGFHFWRRVCPLAAFQLLASRVPRKKQRRIGESFEKHSYMVAMGILATCLVVRLLAINGDGPALAIFLGALAVAAFATGAVFTGKTWCNFLCPVGVVEKIYTEPSSLGAQGNSQCSRCTACKKHCPDIDQENGYWKELKRPARRTAYYLFPGLVLTFYLSYALPRGTMEDYFSGTWTSEPGQWTQSLAPGLWLFPGLPKLVVIPLFVGLGMALSYGILRGLEVLLERRLGFDEARTRHITLAVAAFAAFNLFYLFAGQPSFRKVPTLPQLVPLAVVSAATLTFSRRLVRREDDFIEERSVRKLLAKWPYPDPPPSDPKEVMAYVKVKSGEQAQVLAIYEEAVRSLLDDGVVDAHDHRILERLRGRLGVTQKQHDVIIARLDTEERELFDPARARSVERRLQEESYDRALQALLLKRPRPDEIESLRRAYGVEPERHAAILAARRAPTTAMRDHANGLILRVEELHDELRTIAPYGSVRAFRLLTLVLSTRSVAAIDRTIEMMSALGPETEVRALRPLIFAPARTDREVGLRQLAALVDPPMVDRIAAAVLDPQPRGELDRPKLVETLARLVQSHDPMIAAAALLAAGAAAPEDGSLPQRFAARASDQHPLVRECFALLVSMVRAGSAPELMRKLAQDADPRVRAAAQLQLAEGESAPPLLSAGDTIPATDASITAASALFGAIPSSHVAREFAQLPTPARMLSLARIALFADLEPEYLYDLACIAVDHVVDRGGFLCREGDPGDDLFVIREGLATVYQGSGDSRRVLATVGKGDAIGELAVITGSGRTATVEVERRVVALMISGTAYRNLLSMNGDLAVRMLSIMTRRFLTMTTEAR